MPVVHSREVLSGDPPTHRRATLTPAIPWLIPSIIGGSILITAAISVTIYFLSTRRSRMLAASISSCPAATPRSITIVETTLTPLDAVDSIMPNETAVTVEKRKSSGLRRFLSSSRRSTTYTGDLPYKTPGLHRTNTISRFTNLPASAFSSSKVKGKTPSFDPETLHSPPVAYQPIRSATDTWLIGTPTLPDLAVEQGQFLDQEALEKERERFYMLGNGNFPYPMFSGQTSSIRNASSAPALNSGLDNRTFTGPRPLSRAIVPTVSKSSELITSPQSTTLTTSSDVELNQILRSTDQRLQVPPATATPSTATSCAVTSILHTPTSVQSCSSKFSSLHTPVASKAPVPLSPARTQLACTLNVAQWQILTPEDMMRSAPASYDSESFDTDVGFEDNEDNDEYESVLTQEFSQEYSTALSPSNFFFRQSIEPPDIGAPERRDRSSSASSLSTLHSVSSRENAPSPTGLSTASTKFDDADDAASEFSDDYFTSALLQSFPISKHHSITKPLTVMPLNVPGRKIFSCPPPPREMKENIEPEKKDCDVIEKTPVGSPIRSRQPAIKLSAPPFSTSTSSLTTLEILKTRPRSASPKKTFRRPAKPLPSAHGTKRSSLTIPKKTLPKKHRDIAPLNNDNPRLITPYKGDQVRTITHKARSQALAATACAKSAGAKSAKTQANNGASHGNKVRPIRSSPTLGGHDHGSASVGSPTTSGSSSPASASSLGSLVVSKRRGPNKIVTSSAKPPTIVVSGSMRSCSSTSRLRPSGSKAPLGSGNLSTSYSSSSLLSLPDQKIPPSHSFQMALSRGAGPSGIFIPQSTSTSSFDLTPLTALDVTITELRRRNSGVPAARTQSYNGPVGMNIMGFAVGMDFNNSLLADSPTLPHRYTPIPMSDYVHQPDGTSRRRTHTGLTSSGSVAHLGNNVPRRSRRHQVMSKASREDMRAGMNTAPTTSFSSPLYYHHYNPPHTQTTIHTHNPAASSLSVHSRSIPSTPSSLSHATSYQSMSDDLPLLTKSQSGWTEDSLDTPEAAAAASKGPGRKPSVTFAKMDDVVLLSDDSGMMNRLSSFEDSLVFGEENEIGVSSGGKDNETLDIPKRIAI